LGVDPRISAVAASGVTAMISRAGADCERVLALAGLRTNDVDDASARFGLSLYCEMFEQAARQTGMDSFGLRYGRDYQIKNMGPLGHLALRAPTLGAALANMCRYFPAVQEHSTLRLREDGGLLRLDYQIRDGRIGARRQDAELSIAIFLNLFRTCLGAGWAPEQVHFEHARAADLAEHREILRAPVYFSQGTNAILFRKAEAATRMPDADAGQMAALQAEVARQAATARPDDFIGRLAQEIRAGFATGDASIEAVAARLGHSRASLYRLLAARGLVFSDLSQSIRQEMALRYVAQPHMPLTEIAPLLGYSELSAFSRAFARWTGMAPARYRAAKLVDQPPV
jgi:AraC-like DNA-binding protein